MTCNLYDRCYTKIGLGLADMTMTKIIRYGLLYHEATQLKSQDSFVFNGVPGIIGFEIHGDVV